MRGADEFSAERLFLSFFFPSLSPRIWVCTRFVSVIHVCVRVYFDAGVVRVISVERSERGVLLRFYNYGYVCVWALWYDYGLNEGGFCFVENCVLCGAVFVGELSNLCMFESLMDV